MNYYRRFPGDYLRDTVHLTMLQDGAYGRLLDACYSHEKALPRDRQMVYAMARAKTDEEMMAVDVVLSEFFVETKHGFVNRRASEEIKRANLRAKSARENGLHGGRPKTQSVSVGLANVKQAGNPIESSPDSRLQTPYIRENLKSFPSAKPAEDFHEFDVFWDAFPKKLGKQDARKAWKRNDCQGHLGEVLASIASWKKTEQWGDPLYIPYPSTWLNKGFWKENPRAAVESTKPGLQQQLETLLRKQHEPGSEEKPN